MSNFERDSDEIRAEEREERDKYWKFHYRLKELEKINVEKRLRDLEDYRLAASVTHKNMIKWIGIMSAALSALISLVEHMLFR